MFFHDMAQARNMDCLFQLQYGRLESWQMFRVFHLLSGDPAYIPRLNNARNLIREHERDEIIEELVRFYLQHNGDAK